MSSRTLTSSFSTQFGGHTRPALSCMRVLTTAPCLSPQVRRDEPGTQFGGHTRPAAPPPPPPPPPPTPPPKPPLLRLLRPLRLLRLLLLLLLLLLLRSRASCVWRSAHRARGTEAGRGVARVTKKPSSGLQSRSTAARKRSASRVKCAAVGSSPSSRAIRARACASPNMTLPSRGRQPSPPIECSCPSRSAYCQKHPGSAAQCDAVHCCTLSTRAGRRDRSSARSPLT